jgi:LysR family transcriptional regulator of gallate degradation
MVHVAKRPSNILGLDSITFGYHTVMLARDLRYFLVLADHRHVGRAADALGLSQPALSKSLGRLEEMAKAQLFERSRHGVALTSSGRVFAERARLILRDIDAALEEVQAFQGSIKGTVRVGAIPTICEQFLPQALGSILADHHDLRISVSSNWHESLFAMLDAGETDLIITGLKAPLTKARYVCRPLLHDEVGIVCRAGHPILSNQRINAKVLGGQSWTIAGAMAPGRQWLEERIAERRLARPTIAVETESLVLAREIVLRSDLLGFLPLQVARAEINAGRLIWGVFPDFVWRRTIYIVYSSARRTSAATRFLITCLERMSADC